LCIVQSTKNRRCKHNAKTVQAISERKGKVMTLSLRRHNSSYYILHYVGIKAHERHVCIIYVHDLPSNPQLITHSWEPTTTYMNLTEDEIRNSVIRAQELNCLTTARQVRDEMFTINAISESWTPRGGRGNT